MPAVTTKFTKDDQLDFKMFNVNIQAQVDAGVSGIVLGGTLGEASTLTTSEKSELIKNTILITENKIPVLMNIAEQSTSEAIKSAISAEKDGASGLMILPPMRYKASDDETVNYFKSIAQSTSLPIMIYNNPVDYKIEVTLEMFDQLLECENNWSNISNVTSIL